MTTTFATDENNDIYLGMGNNLALANGLDAVMAACETASKAQLGEMVLETGRGIPNFQTIWSGSPNFSLWESYLRRTLLAIPDVLEVAGLELSTVENVLRYTATIKTTFGSAVLNG